MAVSLAPSVAYTVAGLVVAGTALWAAVGLRAQHASLKAKAAGQPLPPMAELYFQGTAKALRALAAGAMASIAADAGYSLALGADGVALGLGLAGAGLLLCCSFVLLLQAAADMRMRLRGTAARMAQLGAGFGGIGLAGLGLLLMVQQGSVWPATM